MKKLESIPYGKKVKLIQDYQLQKDRLSLQPGDIISTSEKGMKIEKSQPRLPKPKIPAGTIGVVEEGSYCGGIFDYNKECPVQFGIDDPMVPETLGVPWELLEFA